MNTPAPEPAASNAILAAAHQQADWTLEQLWIHYLALGGTAVIFDVEAHLADLNALPLAQHDVLACALNERLADLQDPLRVPYALHPHDDTDAVDPLDVLDDLLGGNARCDHDSGRGRPCLRRPGQSCPGP